MAVSCVIVVPIYKEQLDEDEYNSVRQLFKILGKHIIVAICPQSLDLTYYKNNFNFADFYYFYDSYFKNYPSGYNSLMLNSGFYKYFENYEYMLLYQTDAWVFRDELEYWCNKGYDYIGAPTLYYWDYISLHKEITDVGNGGFSLRKISWFIKNCDKYKDIANRYIIEKNSPVIGEDRFISYINTIRHINCANIPNCIEAAEFSLDTDPNFFYQIIHKLPFGCHAYKKVIYKDFWNNIIFNDNKKIFSIVTYLFGDYDPLRDPEYVDPMAEYICITNNKSLKSDVWQFIYDDEINNGNYTNWQRTMITRYKVLDYIHTDLCIHFDGTVQQIHSLLKYYYIFDSNDCCFMLHPYRSTFTDEWNQWIKDRNLESFHKENFIAYCKNKNYDYNEQGIIMTTIMIQKNNDINKELNKYVLSELMNNFNFSIRVDQLYFTVIFSNEFYKDMKTCFISQQALDSKYFKFYYHNSDITHHGEYPFDLSQENYHRWKNKFAPCIHLI